MSSIFFQTRLSLGYVKSNFGICNKANNNQYQVTVVVPAVSPGKGLHGVWPGLQNQAGSFVYQSVIADSNSPGAWQFWVEYCCKYVVIAVGMPYLLIVNQSRLQSSGYQRYRLQTSWSGSLPNFLLVYPGDSITSTFTTDNNGSWTDSWSLSPGPQGVSVGQKAQSGSTSQNFGELFAPVQTTTDNA